MRLITLKHDAVFQVHYVHPGEHLGYRLRRVRKGTKVFATPDGTPIVAQVCGNPLRSSPGVSMMNYAVEAGRLTNIPDFAPDEPRLAEASDFVPTEHVNRNAEPVTESMTETETVSAVAEEPIPPIPIESLSGKSVADWATSGILALGGLAGLNGGSGGKQSGGSGASGGGSSDGGLTGGGISAGPNPDDGDGSGGGGSLGNGGLDGGGSSGDNGDNGGAAGSGGGGFTINAPEPGIVGLLLSAATMTGAYSRVRRRRKS